MNGIKRLAIILCSCALLAACSQQDQTKGTELDPEKLVRNCIGCHGTDLAGRSAPSLLDVQEKYTQEEISEIILYGTGRMPEIKSMNEEQADILAAWLLEQE